MKLLKLNKFFKGPLGALFSLLIPSLLLAQPVVERLQSHLHDEYFPEIETLIGDCVGDSCISQRADGAYQIKTRDGVACLPYTNCEFYQCMEEKFQCAPEGVNYFTELAHPTCSQYVKNIDLNHFSKKGVEWIYSVMVCLQKGLVEECEVKGNCTQETRKKTCDYITEFTLKFHPGCYINSGVGVCKLPLKDKLAIWKTVKPYLTPRERIEAYKVVFHCVTHLGRN